MRRSRRALGVAALLGLLSGASACSIYGDRCQREMTLCMQRCSRYEPSAEPVDSYNTPNKYAPTTARETGNARSSCEERCQHCQGAASSTPSAPSKPVTPTS